MKLKIIFSVDKTKLAFFAKFFEIEKKCIFEDANKNLIHIEKIWNQKSITIENIFLKIFNRTLKDEIKIFIFPEYFYLGATETVNQIILFGQPPRTENFSLAIIVHEIGHIFLSKIKSKKPTIIDEIICFMLEDYMYSFFDKKSLSDVWKEDELDIFHLNAIRIAINEIKDRGPILDRNLDEIIDTLISRLDRDTLDIRPEKGLIKNIQKHK
ncbi:MAG: hypothetical protein WA091_02920 [Minisyncoccales bacterium]